MAIQITGAAADKVLTDDSFALLTGMMLDHEISNHQQLSCVSAASHRFRAKAHSGRGQMGTSASNTALRRGASQSAAASSNDSWPTVGSKLGMLSHDRRALS